MVGAKGLDGRQRLGVEVEEALAAWDSAEDKSLRVPEREVWAMEETEWFEDQVSLR